MIGHLLRTIRRRLYRDRRRLVIVCVLTFAAGALSQWGAPNFRGGPVPSWLVMGLAYAVVFTSLAALVNLTIPSMRHTDEIVALALLIRSIMGIYSVDYAMLRLGDASSFAFFLIATLVLGQLYWSQALDRFWPKCRLTSWFKSSSKLPADVLFDGLVSYPEGAARNISGDKIISCLWEDREAGICRLEERMDAVGTTITELSTFSELDPPNTAVFTFKAANAAEGALLSSGTKALWMTDKGTKRVIKNRLSFDRGSWRAWLFVWIDDSFGRIQDGHIADLERREVKGETEEAEPQPA